MSKWVHGTGDVQKKAALPFVAGSAAVMSGRGLAEKRVEVKQPLVFIESIAVRHPGDEVADLPRLPARAS
jgi:hypothetical protein